MKALTELLSFEINETNLPVRREQVRARIAMLPTMVGSQMLLAPLLVWLIWDAVAHGVLLGWLALVYAIHTFELIHWRLYRTFDGDIQSCRRWDKHFRLHTGIAALAWGAGWVVMFVPGDIGYQALLICVAMGMSSGAVTLNPVYRPSLFIYILLFLPPLIVRVAMENDRSHWILAVMLVIYIGLLLDAAIKLMRTFELSLAQRFENAELLRALNEREKEAVEAMMKAEQANQAKSKFLATASHDLRQPLQALRLFSDALPGTTKEPEALRLAGQIGKSVNALVDMFDDLLDVSRMDAGIVRMHRKHFTLFPLFDRLYADFAPLAHVKALDLTLPVGEISGAAMTRRCEASGAGIAASHPLQQSAGCAITSDLASVVGSPSRMASSSTSNVLGGAVVYSDPVLLERMLRNLISNAIRYTDSGSVEVKMRHIDGNIWLEVVDTGIGISQDAMPHIFEEYYQADNPHRDRRKGLGLGLAIVRRIEGILGCRVAVRSVPGAGSSFTFAVPAGDPILLINPFSISHSNHDLKGVVVALVEDDQDIREFVAKLMERWGCRVFDGETGDEVMRKLDMAGVPPCLLVCDYRLPHGMTATRVIRRMRELWGNDLPALVLTGDTATETLHEIHSCGAVLLHKPISPARLRSTMYFALHSED
jgi:signal transduction histidine kinase